MSQKKNPEDELKLPPTNENPKAESKPEEITHTPMEIWESEKKRRTQQLQQLRKQKAEVVGSLKLLEEDLEKINVELAGISGEMAGGDLAFQILENIEGK